MQKMGMFQTVPFWIAKAEYLIIHLGMQRECFNGSAGADRERAVDTWMPRYWVKKQEGFNWYRITVNVCLELAGLYQKMANRWVVMWTADVAATVLFILVFFSPSIELNVTVVHWKCIVYGLLFIFWFSRMHCVMNFKKKKSFLWASF